MGICVRHRLVTKQRIGWKPKCRSKKCHDREECDWTPPDKAIRKTISVWFYGCAYPRCVISMRRSNAMIRTCSLVLKCRSQGFLPQPRDGPIHHDWLCTPPSISDQAKPLDRILLRFSKCLHCGYLCTVVVYLMGAVVAHYFTKQNTPYTHSHACRKPNSLKPNTAPSHDISTTHSTAH